MMDLDGDAARRDGPDWFATMSAAMREFVEAILAADRALGRTCGSAKQAVAIILGDQRRLRRAERSGWARKRPRAAPQDPLCRPIAIALRRRSPPRNRARSLPGGKWAARRAA